LLFGGVRRRRCEDCQQKVTTAAFDTFLMIFIYIHCASKIFLWVWMGVGWRGTALLLVLGFELVRERELGCLFLELGKLVLVLGDLLEGGLDELALHV